MDCIFIKDLNIVTVIGVFEWERRIPQTLRLDLSFATDVARAAETDTLADTIDYAAVATSLHDLGKESVFNLVETFAERCAERVMKEFGVPWVRISVTKEVAIPGPTAVGVVIERGQLPDADNSK